MDAILITTAVPDNVSASVGRIIILWANLEWRVSLLAYQILHLDETAGQEVVRTPRLTERFDVLLALISQRNMKLSIDMTAFRKELTEMVTRRDWLGHGIWYQTGEDEWTVRASKGQMTLPGPPQRKISLRKEPQGILINRQWCQNTMDRIQALIVQSEQIDHEIAATS